MLPCSGSDTEVVIIHKSKVKEKSKMKLAVGSFILTLKEKFKLTQTSLNYTVQSLDKIIQISANDIKHSVMKELQECGYPTSIVEECFNPVNPFNELQTEYQQTKFFKKILALL